MFRWHQCSAPAAAPQRQLRQQLRAAPTAAAAPRHGRRSGQRVLARADPQPGPHHAGRARPPPGGQAVVQQGQRHHRCGQENGPTDGETVSAGTGNELGKLLLSVLENYHICPYFFRKTAEAKKIWFQLPKRLPSLQMRWRGWPRSLQWNALTRECEL